MEAHGSDIEGIRKVLVKIREYLDTRPDLDFSWILEGRIDSTP